MPNVSLNIADVNSWKTGAMKITRFSVSMSYLLKRRQRLVYSLQKARNQMLILVLDWSTEKPFITPFHLLHLMSPLLVGYLLGIFSELMIASTLLNFTALNKALSPLHLVEMILKPSDGKESRVQRHNVQSTPEMVRRRSCQWWEKGRSMRPLLSRSLAIGLPSLCSVATPLHLLGPGDISPKYFWVLGSWLPPS